MKLWACIPLLCCVVVFGQEHDTLHMKAFEVSTTVMEPSEAFMKSKPDSALMKTYGNERLATVLQYGSPLFVKNYGPGSIASVSFRGTGASHTKFYWNGIELNNAALGQNDLNMLTTGSDQVEVLHSGAGIFLGAGGIGGAVSMTSNIDTTPRTRIQLHGRVGSFGEENAGARLSFSRGKFGGKTALLYHQAENNFLYKDYTLPGEPDMVQKHASYEFRNIVQDLWWKYQHWTAQVRIWHTYQDRDLPKLITQSNPSQATQHDERNRVISSLKYNHNDWKINLTSGYLFDQIIYRDPASNIDANSILNTLRNSFIVAKTYKNWLWRGQIKYDHIIANIAEYGNDIKSNRASAGFNTSWKPFSNLLLDGIIRTNFVNDRWLPYTAALGVKWTLARRFNIHGNAAKHTRYPNMNDLYWQPGGNPNLLPETGYNTELGLAFEPRKMKRFTAGITGYYGLIDNWIRWIPTGNLWSAQNVKQVENSGLELYVKKGLTIKSWQIQTKVQYAYTRSTNLQGISANDASVSKQLIYVPYHKASGFITLTRKRFRLLVASQYIGKRFITTDNSIYLPRYQLVDVELSQGFAMKSSVISAFARIDNIFNIAYQAIAYRPMPGINIKFGIRLNYENLKK